MLFSRPSIRLKPLALFFNFAVSPSVPLQHKRGWATRERLHHHCQTGAQGSPMSAAARQGTHTHTLCWKYFVPWETRRSPLWQILRLASHVFSPVLLPLWDSAFKEKTVLEAILWQEINVLFGTVIFQIEGLDGRGGGLAQCCYVASGSEPWL